MTTLHVQRLVLPAALIVVRFLASHRLPPVLALTDR
jgi:hypothetical protein